MTEVLVPRPKDEVGNDLASFSQMLAKRTGRLLVLNDEAHHTHEEENEWNTASEEQRNGSYRSIVPQRPDKPVSAARLRLADWTLLLTNIPTERLSVTEAVVLVRCRWQIELLWKQWKQEGKLDTWGSYKAERILTEISAKLLGLLITHWLTLIGCWQAPTAVCIKPNRRSSG